MNQATKYGSVLTVITMESDPKAYTLGIYGGIRWEEESKAELNRREDTPGEITIMQSYRYHADSEEMFRELDEEFQIVTVVGRPSDWFSTGYDIVIYDERSKDRIAEVARKINNKRDRKA